MIARAYVRVSTARQQTDGISLETQREQIEAYARQHGYTLVAIYCDVLSGTRADRPEYQRLVREMQPGETILTWRLDRIGRNKSELFRFFEEIKAGRIALISVTQPELSNELVRDIMSVLAAYESQQIAERVLPNMTRAVEDGRWIGRAPHFYDLVDGHLVPAANSADAIACWELFVATGNRNMTAAAFGLGRRQLHWMMHNPVYLGHTRWMGRLIRDTHPGIVPPDLWEAAHAIADGRLTGKRRERRDSALLVGFLYVGETGERLSHKENPSKRDPTVVYRYYVTDPDRYHEKTRYSVRAARAETAVLDALRGLQLSPETRAAIEGGLRDRLRRDPAKRQRAALTRRVAALEAEQVATLRLHASGAIDGAKYARAAEAQDRDLADTRARLAALPPLPDLAAARAVLEVRMRLAERIDHAAATGNVAALRLLIEALIARVEVWGAASPRLAGTNARIYYRDHPPEIRIRWRSEVEETEPDRE